MDGIGIHNHKYQWKPHRRGTNGVYCCLRKRWIMGGIMALIDLIIGPNLLLFYLSEL